jgi:hypothetical protein
LIAIVRTADAETAMTQSRRLLAIGVQVIEVAFTTSGAAEVVQQLGRAAGSGAVIGAGTREGSSCTTSAAGSWPRRSSNRNATMSR